MTGRDGILQRFRQTGLLLALLAVLLKASAPPGYMLEQVGGRLVVALCSGAPVVIDLSGDQPSKHDRSGQDAPPCPFAVTAQAGAPPPLIGVEPRSATSWVLAPIGVARVVVTGLAAPPPWATGPPTSI